MPDKRKRYSEEFKSQCLQYLEVSKKTYSEVARKFGVNPGTIAFWKRQRREELHQEADKATEGDKPIRDPWETIAELEAENRFLKKALAFFETGKVC